MTSQFSLDLQRQFTPATTRDLDFQIEPRPGTPLVKFNGKKGVLMVKGHSTDMDVHAMYESLLALVEEYLSENQQLTCYFFFKQYNTTTAKTLFDLFKLLKQQERKRKKIVINWFSEWDNKDMIETGIDFADLFELKFNILPV